MGFGQGKAVQVNPRLWHQFATSHLSVGFCIHLQRRGGKAVVITDDGARRLSVDGAAVLARLADAGWQPTGVDLTIVALRPVLPAAPFGVPKSIRPLNPEAYVGSTAGFSNIDPLTGGARATLDALAPAGHAIDIHLTMTDDHPWAQAFVILTARKLEP